MWSVKQYNGYMFYPKAFRNLEYNIQKAPCSYEPVSQGSLDPVDTVTAWGLRAPCKKHSSLVTHPDYQHQFFCPSLTHDRFIGLDKQKNWA